MAGRRRGFETLGDMARSLGVVLAVVALVVLITIRTKGQVITLVDVPGTYAQATIGSTPFPLITPTGLTDRWRATSVYYNPPERTGVPGVTLWHIGYVTPADQYAGMEQTNGVAMDALEAQLTAPKPVGVSTVRGASWQRWSGDGNQRRAIERTSGGVTVLVDGTAGWAELETLAGALHAKG